MAKVQPVMATAVAMPVVAQPVMATAMAVPMVAQAPPIAAGLQCMIEASGFYIRQKAQWLEEFIDRR